MPRFTRMRLLACHLVAALVLASAAVCAQAGGLGKIELIRDEWGIPHVFADADAGTIKSQAAQSYTQFVSLHDPDAAMTILPIGQSERPGSASRTSTMKLWEEGRLHPAPLSRKAIMKYAKSRTVLRQRPN
ncbi:MAG: penicillin acylase family protein [Armatimonadota bacterium]